MRMQWILLGIWGFIGLLVAIYLSDETDWDPIPGRTDKRLWAELALIVGMGPAIWFIGAALIVHSLVTRPLIEVLLRPSAWPQQQGNWIQRMMFRIKVNLEQYRKRHVIRKDKQLDKRMTELNKQERDRFRVNKD